MLSDTGISPAVFPSCCQRLASVPQFLLHAVRDWHQFSHLRYQRPSARRAISADHRSYMQCCQRLAQRCCLRNTRLMTRQTCRNLCPIARLSSLLILVATLSHGALLSRMSSADCRPGCRLWSASRNQPTDHHHHVLTVQFRRFRFLPLLFLFLPLLLHLLLLLLWHCLPFLLHLHHILLLLLWHCRPPSPCPKVASH